MHNLPTDKNERQRRLVARRDKKMARSAYGYMRGDVRAHYDRVREMKIALPQGPSIWICGDCHFGNLGPISDGQRSVDVQIRDLDQTVVGNPAQDVLRLASSLASVARGVDMPGERALRVIASVLQGYAAGLRAESDAAIEPDGIRSIRRHASARKWRHVAKDRLGNTAPRIVLGKRFWPLLHAERRDLQKLVQDPTLRHDVLDASTDDLEFLDAAYWVKGCSSLGSLRFALLVRSGGRTHLLDVKEAVSPLPPIAEGATMPADDAFRVVAGARALSPNLGARMAATEIAGRPVFVRVLSPEDLKLETNLMVGEDAEATARHLGSIVGRAHGRQLDARERLEWADRAMGQDARGDWLFEAVVELLVRYDDAYYHHCHGLVSAA